jgi:hypothetical protein
LEAPGAALGEGGEVATSFASAPEGLGTGFDPTLPNAFEGLGADSEGLGAQAAGEAGFSPGTGAGGPEKGFLSNVWEGGKASIAKNPLGIAAAGGGLALNMFKGNGISPEQQKLKDQADQLGAQGKQLQSYLSSGTLPPAMKAQLDQATAAAKARIVSNHAKSGMPTDPSQNSALAQELNAVDMNAVSAMAAAQIDMMKTGLSETGLSSQLYQMLVKMDRQDNTDLMAAISSFAAAIGGGYGSQKKAA